MRTDDRRIRVAASAAACLIVLVAGACGGGAAGPPPANQPSASQPSASQSSASPSRSPRPVESPAPGDHQLALDWDGQERTYELHAPPSYRPGRKLPLVVVLHYRGGDPAVMRAMTRFDAKADAAGFLVAYPVGLDGAMNALICCGSNDDVGFVRSMVEHLTRSWGADPARIYATGISNGADMSFRLAVEVPGMFAAIAPVSGGLTGARATDDASFKPSRPVSVVSFIGNDDRIADTLEIGLRAWRAKLGCPEGRAVWVDPGKTVNRTTARCADGTAVVGYTINGMGHAWPGSSNAGLGDTRRKINAVDVMWEFFKAHRSAG